jgi:hypothetical protein
MVINAFCSRSEKGALLLGKKSSSDRFNLITGWWMTDDGKDKRRKINKKRKFIKASFSFRFFFHFSSLYLHQNETRTKLVI